MPFLVEIPRQATLNTAMEISCSGRIQAITLAALASLGWGGGYAPGPAPGPAPAGPSGKAAGPSPFTDYTSERPGKRIKITPADLPPPRATQSADNPPRVVKRPKAPGRRRPRGSRWSRSPTGWRSPASSASRPTATCSSPRARTASRVFRGRRRRQAARSGVFAKGLNRPFGIAFYPPGGEPRYVYVGNTDSVVRFPYRNGDTKARGPGRDDRQGHPQRQRAASAAAATGRATWSSRPTARRCSSRSARGRTSTTTTPARSAAPTSWRSTPTARTSASSPRASATPSAWPRTRRPAQLWTSVNERDGLGDHLVPDYITHVEEGGFYGWPWYYLGPQPGPAAQGEAPRAEGQGDRPRRALAVALGLARHDVLRRRPVPEGVPRTTPSPPSTARGTGPAAPATRSSACR